MPRNALSRPDEYELIERYFRPLAGEGAFGLADDAALLSFSQNQFSPGHRGEGRPEVTPSLIISTDMIAEGVHFLPGDPAETIARKALRVNISDLTAKGAKPLAYTLGLALRSDFREAWLADFCAALAEDQNRYGISLIGGDTITLNLPSKELTQHVDREYKNQSGVTLISVTVMGSPANGDMVKRSGGSAGDLLFVSGMIGSAAAGLSILTEPSGPFSSLPVAIIDLLKRAYRVPDPPAEIAGLIARYAGAAMDISDGLIGDCDKLALASGCTGVIHAETIPIHAGLSDLAGDDAILSRMMTGGDDYQALVAVPAASAQDFVAQAAALGIILTEIGQLAEGSEPIHVIRHGQPMAVKDRSYKHASRNREQ